MAKAKSNTGVMLRQPAEMKYAEELEYLFSIDKGTKPFSWRLSPQMVRTFVLGSLATVAANGTHFCVGKYAIAKTRPPN